MDIKKERALIIGCGNIGAFYDFQDTTGKIWTHAKALHSFGRFKVDVTDHDSSKAEIISNNYGFNSVSGKIDLSVYSLVCIATSTSSHARYLKDSFDALVPVVICEKPVGDSVTDLKALLVKKGQSSTKVIVNYIRRFQPAYIELKEWLKGHTNELTGIQIVYCRGFVNNCSHALDLLEFLLDEKTDLHNFEVQSKTFDAFPDDPTLNGSFHLNEIPIQVMGLPDLQYSVFEITLFLKEYRINICNSGDTITYYKNEKGKLKSQHVVDGVLLHYMIPVVEYACALLDQKITDDNLNSAAELNIKMINVINNGQKTCN